MSLFEGSGVRNKYLIFMVLDSFVFGSYRMYFFLILGRDFFDVKVFLE